MQQSSAGQRNLYGGASKLMPMSRVSIAPTSYSYKHENLFFLDPEIIDVGGLDGPGAPETTLKGGALLLEWFLETPEPSRP